MQVIIVEDHAFNAYCLTSLLQEVNPQVTVTLITNSLELNDYLSHSHADLIILDGDLGASDGLCCNGPAVADSLLQTNPMIPLIVWTSSPAMRAAFASVFAEHQLRLSDDNCWPKMVSTDRIRHSLKTCSSNCRSNTHIYQPIRSRL